MCTVASTRARAVIPVYRAVQDTRRKECSERNERARNSDCERERGHARGQRPTCRSFVAGMSLWRRRRRVAWDEHRRRPRVVREAGDACAQVPVGRRRRILLFLSPPPHTISRTPDRRTLCRPRRHLSATAGLETTGRTEPPRRHVLTRGEIVRPVVFSVAHVFFFPLFLFTLVSAAGYLCHASPLPPSDRSRALWAQFGFFPIRGGFRVREKTIPRGNTGAVKTGRGEGLALFLLQFII